MRWTMPVPDVKDIAAVFHCHGVFIGGTKTRAVWSFGWLRTSRLAELTGHEVPTFTWILATESGKKIETWKGYANDLPKRFRAVLNKEL